MSDSRPHIELFVKSSTVDKEVIGACPISQKWCMVFYTMVKHNLVNFTMTVINLEHPADSYVSLNVARRFPVALVQSGHSNTSGDDLTGRIFDGDEEIESLMTHISCPGMDLAYSAFKVTENLYRNFNNFLVNNNVDPLAKNLEALDNFLENREVPFLSGYDLSYIDCHTMPKLQHIRITCENYKDWQIPKELKGLWKYFQTMYDTEAFTISCPSDRDILLHYFDKVKPRPVHRTPPTLINDSRTNQIS